MVRDSTTEAKKGTVLDQSPKAGSKEDKGRTVTIVVSDSFEPPSPSPARPPRRRRLPSRRRRHLSPTPPDADTDALTGDRGQPVSSAVSGRA